MHPWCTLRAQHEHSTSRDHYWLVAWILCVSENRSWAEMELLLPMHMHLHAAAESLNMKLSTATVVVHTSTLSCLHQQTPLNAQKYIEHTSINLHAHVTQVPSLAMCISMHATFIAASISATPTSCQWYYISTTVTLLRFQVVDRILYRNWKDLP
jgi:hypothetical protein